MKEHGSLKTMTVLEEKTVLRLNERKLVPSLGPRRAHVNVMLDCIVFVMRSGVCMAQSAL